MVYFVGHFNIEDLHYPQYTRMGTAGGACLYAAMGAAVWCADVAVVSRIGEDYPGKYLAKLQAMGVKMYLQRLPGPTMASHTEYKPGQDRKFTMKNPPQRLYELTPDVSDVQQAQIPAGAHVHLGAMNVDNLERIVCYLRSRNCFISLDTCDAFVQENEERFLRIVAQTDLFLPSRSELFSFFSQGRRLKEQALWLARHTATRIVVKDSRNGSYVVQGTDIVNVPIYAPAIAVDLTGAGDSFCGGLLAHMALSQSDLVCAAAAGTVSSSYIIQQGGAFVESPITLQDRDARYNNVIKNTDRKEP